MKFDDVILINKTELKELVLGKYYKITDINENICILTLCTKKGKVYKKSSSHMTSVIEEQIEKENISLLKDGIVRKIIKINLNELKEKVYNEDRNRSINIITNFIVDVKEKKQIKELLTTFNVDNLSEYSDEEITDISYRFQEIYYTK
jgi:hypothetical protein